MTPDSAFRIPALEKEEGKRPLLCPVRALKRYLKVTEGKRRKCSTLFLNPVIPDTPVAKNTISFWIREVIRRNSDPAGVKTQEPTVSEALVHLCNLHVTIPAASA